MRDSRLKIRQVRKDMREALPKPYSKDVESVFAVGIVTMVAMGVATAVVASVLRATLGDSGPGL